MSTGRLAVTCPVVVGRDHVLDVLRAQLDAVGHEGRSRGVVTLLAGDPGMGKTRVAAEAVRLAEARGHLVLTGECRSEAAGYEPFTSALARHERALLPGETELLFADRARAARVLLPTVFGDAPPAADTPTHVQAALVELLRKLSAWTPVTLLLEDLQWATRDAVELLLGVVAEVPELPVWVVGTYRPTDVVAPDVFARLSALVDRRHPDERITLDPLTADDVRRMLEATFPRRGFADAFVTALHHRSGGTPFVVEELCRTLLDREAFDDERGVDALDVLTLPDTVRTALTARLDRLSDAGRGLVEAAAVTGEELDLDLLGEVTGQEPETLHDAVARCLELQVLVERRDEPVPVYAFTHALTRDAIVAGLPPPRRRALHRRVAEVVARRDGDTASALVTDHLVAAGATRDAAPWARAAARRAAAHLQPRQAADRFEQAVELTPDGPDRVAVAVEAAEFGFYADRPGAVPLAERARRLAGGAGTTDLEARALVVLGRTRWITGDPDAVAPLERALRLVADRGDGLELAVVLETAYHLARTGWREDATRADDLLARASALAGVVADDGLHARLALVRAARTTDHDAFLAACRDAGTALARAGNPWAEATSDLLAGHHLVLFHGSLREGARRLRRHQRVQDELTTRRPSVPFSGLALATLWMGDAAAARTLLAEGYWTDSDLSAANWHEGMAELALSRGRVGEAATHARQGLALVEPIGEPAWVLPALGVLGRATLESEGLDAATPVLSRALALTGQSSLSHHWPFSPAWARALHAAGHTEELAHLSDAIAEATAAGGDRGHDVAALRYVQGLHAGAEGRDTAAAEAFAEAADRYTRMPFPSRTIGVWTAWAEQDHRVGRVHDARQRAREALALAQALEGPLLVQRVHRLLGRLGGVPGASAGGAATLTSREREVVRLTVAGHTAREVGELLVISHRTVEGHLERARAKLGAASKADLVRLAIEHAV